VIGTLRLLVFALALSVNGVLLVSMQPMVGKLILPRFGAVTETLNACLVLFGIATAVGYVYAFLASCRSSFRWTPALHLALIAAALALAAFGVDLTTLCNEPADREPNGGPIVATFLLLGPTVGPCLVVLVANSLLLPRWFAEMESPGANDPYFLHAATSLGGFVGLLGYPYLIEPHVRLIDQTRLWTIGYGITSCLVAICAILIWTGRRHTKLSLRLGEPTPLRRGRWVAWSALAGALLFSATQRVPSEFPLPAAFIGPLAL
jgi:hypothetical protein